MTAARKAVTTLSTKGQIVVPKAICDQRNWTPGTRLTVEDTPQGVLLKLESLFPPTRYADVSGMLPYDGPAKTLEEMNAGILAEAKRRHEEGH